MFETFIATSEDYDAYLRPAIYDSIRAVLDFYGLSSATNVIYNGKNEITKLVGNNSTDGPTADRFTDGTFRNKIFIVPEINRSEFWSNRRAMTERPVFKDSDNLPLMVCPAFENKKIVVKVVAMFNTEAEADRMKIRINRQRENQVVDFNFAPITHMVFNEGLIEFIEVIHGLLKKNKPETPIFYDWFMQHSLRPFHFITNVKGNLPQLVSPIKQPTVGIQFSEAFVAKTAKGSTYGRFEVELEYSFYLNDFIGWDLMFPLNVYQDEIPSEYIMQPQKGHTQDINVMAAPEIEDGRAINPPVDKTQTPYYLKLPKHDPWAHPGQFWIQPIIQARLALKDLPQQPLGNIFDLPDFVWQEPVKAYIKRRRDVAFKHHATPFLFQVFENNQLLNAEDLSMDEDGLVTLLRVPDLSRTYRMVVTLDYAVRDYFDSFWNDLGKNEDLWPVITSIFFWFDFNTIPEPWILHIDMIRKHIDKGFGKWNESFNIYEMNLDLFAHNIKDF